MHPTSENLSPKGLQKCVKTVAFLLGFEQPAHFSREFHLLYGSSPSAFLKADAGGVSDPEIERCVDKFLNEFPALFPGRAPVEKGSPKTPGPGRPAHRIKLTPKDLAELKTLVRRRRPDPRQARRARVLLAVSECKFSLRAIAARTGLSLPAIWALCRRYRAHGLDALDDAPRSGRPRRSASRRTPKT
jgi:hypothetical protein